MIITLVVILVTTGKAVVIVIIASNKEITVLILIAITVLMVVLLKAVRALIKHNKMTHKINDNLIIRFFEGVGEEEEWRFGGFGF